jgi:hypothetical protein
MPTHHTGIFSNDMFQWWAFMALNSDINWLTIMYNKYRFCKLLVYVIQKLGISKFQVLNYSKCIHLSSLEKRFIWWGQVCILSYGNWGTFLGIWWSRWCMVIPYLFILQNGVELNAWSRRGWLGPIASCIWPTEFSHISATDK